MHDHDQWTEIEDDAKKLHELVESQKNQINEIVTLISETGRQKNPILKIFIIIFVFFIATSNIRPDKSEEAITDKQPTAVSNITSVSSLLRRIQEITRPQHEPVPTVLKEEPVPIVSQQEPVSAISKQEPMPIVSRQETILENHSPGTSPSQSLATLTLETLATIIDEPKPEIEEPKIETEEQPVEPIHEQEPPHAPFDIPVPPPASPIESKRCPVCNHEFAATSDDVEMYDHIEKCLFPTGINTEPKDYECPNCNRKFPGINETAYLEHLTDCFNRDI
jgi:hypothetical protein